MISVEDLLVDDESEVLDPVRLRRLRRKTAGTSLAVSWAAAGLTALLAAAAGAAAGEAWRATPEFRAPLAFAALSCGVMAAFLAVFARAFQVEAELDPLRTYFGDPEGHELRAARVIGASWRPTEGRRGDCLLTVEFAGGECRAIVEARGWSERFSSRAQEGSLKKGDDWYDRKGKRRHLPARAWVLARTSDGAAALVAVQNT